MNQPDLREQEATPAPTDVYNQDTLSREVSAMGFVQDAPQWPHPLKTDRLLQHLLSHDLPPVRLETAMPDLDALAAWERLGMAPRLITTP